MEPTDHAFDEFCRELSPRLIGALVIQFGDRVRAEDVAQEALARAWSRWPSVAAMNRPQSWVFTVAFRHADGALEAEPVTGFPARSDFDFYRITLKLMQI